MKNIQNYSVYMLLYSIFITVLSLLNMGFNLSLKKELISLSNDYRILQKKENECKNLIIDNIKSKRISPHEVIDNIGFNSINLDSLFYVAFIPSNACKSCISTLFTDIEDSRLSKNNIYLVTEIEDELLKRLWISYGYNKKNCSVDKKFLFKKMNLGDKIGLLMFEDGIENYNFMIYDVLSEKLYFDYFFNRKKLHPR